jgi:2-polyprenyl-3-methyl-5-hydroxy-6-metoxy-1,4-benzoquinol methylase
MSEHAYDTLAEVYDWLAPDALLTPEGSVDAFAGAVVDALEPGSRVLDCAAGTGQLAVGLALRGFDVVATDASAGMIDCTRRLARERGAELEARACAWEDLPAQGWRDGFDAVEDLRAAGLRPVSTTHAADVERYTVTARRDCGRILA